MAPGVDGSPYGACGSKRWTHRKKGGGDWGPGASCSCRSHAIASFDDVRRGALVGEASVGSARQVVAVDVEPAVQAELVIEGKRGDEGGRPEAAGSQLGGQRRHGRRDAHAVVARAVAWRVAAREQRGVRRKRDRRGRVGALEQRTAGRQAVERRRPCARVTVRADMIGSQRIDGDQDQIARRGLRRGRAAGQRHG